MLLRKLSLDFLEKVAKRFDFHSITILLLDIFDKDQTMLNITRLHLTHSTRWPNHLIFPSTFCRVKIQVKNRDVVSGPNTSIRKDSRQDYSSKSIQRVIGYTYTGLYKGAGAKYPSNSRDDAESPSLYFDNF